MGQDRRLARWQRGDLPYRRVLYPRDFIASLPQPSGYYGPERLFGRAALAGDGGEDVPGLDVIRLVRDHEARILTPGRSAPPLDALPASLDEALMDFVLGMAARDTRAGGNPASAMLIHGSPYTYQQDQRSSTDYVVAYIESLHGPTPDPLLPFTFRFNWVAEVIR
jgi:hypothetical protein